MGKRIIRDADGQVTGTVETVPGKIRNGGAIVLGLLIMAIVFFSALASCQGQSAGAVPEVFCNAGYHRVLHEHPVPHFVCKRNHP